MIYRFAAGAPDAFLLLPAAAADKAKDASEEELRVLLALAKLLSKKAMEEDELCAAMDEFSREVLLSALAFWRGCGILKTQKGAAEKPAKQSEAPKESDLKKEDTPQARVIIDADEAPFYSSKDLAEAAKKHPDFKNLVSFAEEKLEKVLGTSELARLYSFLDYLNMPMGVVMLVIQDACDRDKRSLRYVTKVLTSFQDEGIDTYEKAEAYFLQRKESAVYEKYVRSLFGLGDRKLTKTESEMIEKWRCSFGYGQEMLDAAYEKTAGSAKNPSIKYMHKILENWYLSGVKTPAEAQNASPAKNGKAAKSYDLDDFFQAAVANGRKDL